MLLHVDSHAAQFDASTTIEAHLFLHDAQSKMNGLNSQIDSLKVIIVELQVQPFEATKQVNEHETVESSLILKSFKPKDLKKIWLPHKRWLLIMKAMQKSGMTSVQNLRLFYQHTHKDASYNVGLLEGRLTTLEKEVMLEE